MLLQENEDESKKDKVIPETRAFPVECRIFVWTEGQFITVDTFK
ncbi:MAG TPA: hypothetical protein VIF86_02905 [Methylobacter sp.]|jgi:hypothetical protein